MSSSVITQFDRVYQHQLLDELIDALIRNEFVRSRVSNVSPKSISYDDLRKGIWLASLLANSRKEDHVKKAQLFAALVYLNYSNNIDLTRAVYVLLSRTGNLTATKFLTSLFELETVDTHQLKYNYNSSLDAELEYNRDSSTIIVGNQSFLITRFQKQLWNSLIEKNNVSVSAPTSSGKSFIIKKYLKKCFEDNKSFIALYIVPSRALINQVSEEFRIDLNVKDVRVSTAFIELPDIEEEQQKQVYVLTPERCLRLLQYCSKAPFKLDFIFVDEIQNVEEEGGRGTLLEYVLRELFLLNSQSQIVSAGPNIDSSKELFYRIFGTNNNQVQTSISPVFQIRTILRVTDEGLNITLKTLAGKEHIIDLRTELSLKKMFKKSIGSGLPYIIRLVAGISQNIIYSPRTDYAEDWALSFVEALETNDVDDANLLELVDFLEDEIHPRYFLIKCIRNGVAFHHSKLPDIVRKEIEDLFINGKINNLFCTSTLLEGVNLPANNLFVILPKKRTNLLSPFEFGNLIGRAGRIKDSLYGTVYCIERNEADEERSWAETFYNSTFDKEVESVSEKAFSTIDSFIDLLGDDLEDIDESKNKNTIIFLRHKLLKGEEEFENYLRIKQVKSTSIKAMISLLKETIGQITIPSDILSLNPGIDPLLQEKLYNDIKSNGIEEWCVTPNSNFYSRFKREVAERYKFADRSLYWQLVSIVEKLDYYFGIKKEAYFKHNISLSLPQMCIYGLKWLENKSYKELIDQDLAFHSRHYNLNKRIDLSNDKEVNGRIKHIIEINSTVVSHVLVKYLKLLNDLLEFLMNDEEKERYKFSLALPTMLELGTTEPIVMQLISRGISRSVALKIFKVFIQLKGYEEIDVFKWLASQNSIGLKPIYERHLRKLKILAAASNL